MQTQKIVELIIDTNRDAYNTLWNAANNFQEKSDGLIKFAFDKSPLPQAAKDIALKTIDAYKIIVKQFLDINRIGYENAMKTVAVSQEKAERMTKEDYDRTLLQRYPHIILSL
jgi:hypothetical protein